MLAPAAWPAARKRLAPPGAAAIRLCRYSGLNAHPPLTLAGGRLVRAPGLVAVLVADFDRLLAGSPGAVACPADDGSQILALLAYPGGRTVTISAGLTGCALVTNGSVHRTAAGFGSPPAYGPQLVAELERLVHAPPPAPPAGAPGRVRGHWSVLRRSPLGPRYGATFAWDGRGLLEVGGTARANGGGAGSRGSAAYDPARNRWRRVANAPAGLQLAGAASVWTGSRLFVVGGPPPAGRSRAAVAELYDPASDRWTATGPPPILPFNSTGTAVWNGRQVVVAGLVNGHPALQVAAFDPATGLWSKLEPPFPPRHPPMAFAIVATNDGVLLWSLWGRTQKTGAHTYTGHSGVDVFRLSAAGAWANVTGRWPQHHTVDGPIFTGADVLVAPGQIWCGACSHPAPVNEHGYWVDPRTLRITKIPPGPFDDIGPQIVWTGSAEISFNNGGEITGPHVSVLPGDVATWSPVTRRWTRGPRTPLPIGGEPAVWGSGRLYVLARDGRLMAYRP